MPVLVIGAESPVGHAAVSSLRASGGEVRAYADAEAAGDAEASVLRGLGAKVAVGDLDDEAHLEAALTRAHTVVHLAGGPLADPGRHLDSVAVALSAAMGAGCRRIIVLSEVAAAAPEGNPYLEALAQVEALVADSPLESIVVRSGVRYGRRDPIAERLATADLPPEVARARHAPLFVDDLGAAIAAADAARGVDVPVDVAVDLVGPDEVTLGELAGRLRDGRLPAAAGSAGPGSSASGELLPRVLADWLARPGIGGAGALGRDGTPIEKALAAGAGER